MAHVPRHKGEAFSRHWGGGGGGGGGETTREGHMEEED